MPKFSGTKRRRLRANPTAPMRLRTSSHPRARRQPRDDRRVGLDAGDRVGPLEAAAGRRDLRRDKRGSLGSVGHATYGHTAIAGWFDPKRHQRAVILTDDQQHDSGHVQLDHVPLIHAFNLAGYRPSALPAGARGRYTIGGFSDATFTVMKVTEDGRNATWPF